MIKPKVVKKLQGNLNRTPGIVRNGAEAPACSPQARQSTVENENGPDYPGRLKTVYSTSTGP